MCTLFCTGTIIDNEMFEIWVNTDVTTAKLETLWSTTRVACDTTACNCVVTLTTFWVLIVCYGKINLISYAAQVKANILYSLIQLIKLIGDLCRAL